MGDSETPLPSGRMTAGITRRGGSVLRPAGPWTAAVHEYLRHLERAGFGGAPRVLGMAGGREELTFLEGAVGADPGWEPGRPPRLPAFARGDDALVAVGRLVRRLHDASRGFGRWSSWPRNCGGCTRRGRRSGGQYRGMTDFTALPADLPVPEDDGAATHLPGMVLPVIGNGHVEHVFYPVFPPDTHVRTVLGWVLEHPGRGR